MTPVIHNADLAPAGPILGAVDPWWWLLAALAFAFFDWLNRKRQRHEAESRGGEPGLPTPPVRSPRTATPPAAPRPPESRSWEEELRRLLGEDARATPPTTAPPPQRPVIVSQTPPPVTPPPIIVQHLPARPAPSKTWGAPQPVPSILKRVHGEGEEAPTVELARLEQSAAAIHRASQLHETVSQRLRQVDEMTEQHAVSAAGRRQRTVSPEVAAVLAQFRSPRSARQAVIASVILGPPKALEVQS